ncbi:MAG: TolC family protein [Prevotella sp.]|nr:TolC family protein [Prevotella sp.]
MKRRVFVLILSLGHLAGMQAQTLSECVAAAEHNYPLIRQYDLIGQTTHLTLSNLSKEWLPQVQAYAQATLQSDVTAWPDQMQTMMQQMGISLEGLHKDQYRVGIDVSQTVFDGGAISGKRQVAQRQGDVQAAQTEVTLYQVRRRVIDMYYGLLLLDEQLRLKQDLQQLLAASEKKLAAMQQRGTAAQSDHLAMKAERLGADQQLADLQARRQSLARMLGIFCGLKVSQVQKPAGEAAALSQPQVSRRPELKAIDAQLRLADAQERLLDAALMPRLSIFAQGFYGYPGYNLFEDMMHHKWSWNGMIGARLTWNIGALYTRKNDKLRLQAQRSLYDVQRDVFLFNNGLEQQQQREDMERYRQLMEADGQIIDLRTQVRKAAESKLAHGIIDVNDLVREISSENAARVQRSVHELEMLRQISEWQYTTNEQ